MITAGTRGYYRFVLTVLFVVAGIAAIILSQNSFLDTSKTGKSGNFNILLIVVDDLRPEIGAYGNEIIKTPNIDALAARGIRFNSAYVQQATCKASRASLFSGLRPDSMDLPRINMKSLREAAPERVFFPQYFRDNGYYTASFGKIYHANEQDEKSWDKRGSKPEGLYCSPDNIHYSWKNHGPPTEAGKVPDNCYPDGKIADEVVREMEKLTDKRFFLAVGFYKPHLPFNAPEPYWNIYNSNDIKHAKKKLDLVGAPYFALTNFHELRAFRGVPGKGPIPDSLAHRLVHGYYASTSYVDSQIGHVLGELDRLDLRKNTIVVLLGDHGFKLGEYDSWSKHTNFELDTRAPLIVSIPGTVNNNAASNSIVEFIDIFPTIAEIAGLPEPADIDGKSFSAVLENPELRFKKAAFSQIPRGSKNEYMGYSMRTEKYRFTEWRNRTTQEIIATEIYDHDADPDETVNISQNFSTQHRSKLAKQLESGLGLSGK